MKQDGLVTITHVDNARQSVDSQGDVLHFTTETTDVYIFGRIQHAWFFDSDSLRAHFNEQQYYEHFYRQLNGHFSFIIIDKLTNNIRIVANRSGGFRLYVKASGNKLFITPLLANIQATTNKLDNTALSETLDYRWNSGETALLNNVQLLPSGCYWDFIDLQLIHKVCYQYFPDNSVINNKSTKENAIEAERLLSQSLQESIAPNARVAVLLSGGVDSSVLAALAHKYQKNLVAISHRSDDHQNPELATAIQFAEELGIEHQVYTINSSDILDAFINTIAIIEQPARYQSSLLLYKLFEKMAGKFDQVIYGEAADTLFGSSLVKRYNLRHQKQQRLLKVSQKLPLAKQIIHLLPSDNKIRALYNENCLDYMLASSQVEYSTISQQCIEQWRNGTAPLTVLSRLLDNKHAAEMNDITSAIAGIKSFLMRTDRDNHFHETGALAAHFSMELVSPFVDHRVVNFSATLNDNSYYGQDFVKPALRKIGEQYFSPELMYIKKKGFPAPYQAWLDGPLSALWQSTCQHLNFSQNTHYDHEFQWTMICLSLFMKNFNVTVKTN